MALVRRVRAGTGGKHGGFEVIALKRRPFRRGAASPKRSRKADSKVAEIDSKVAEIDSKVAEITLKTAPITINRLKSGGNHAQNSPHYYYK